MRNGRLDQEARAGDFVDALARLRIGIGGEEDHRNRMVLRDPPCGLHPVDMTGEIVVLAPGQSPGETQEGVPTQNKLIGGIASVGLKG